MTARLPAVVRGRLRPKQVRFMVGWGLVATAMGLWLATRPDEFKTSQVLMRACAAATGQSCVAMLGWFCILFFGGGLLFWLVNSMPRFNRIELDLAGLTIRTIFRSRRHRWVDLSDFKVWSHHGQKLVIFDDASASSGPFGSMNRVIAGGNCWIAAAFELAPEELASVLNAWRAKARGLGA